MTNGVRVKGGIAPFGYRWNNGHLEVDQYEAPVRRLIFDLFIKYRRKKTVARILNELGHTTRRGSKFSDTTVDRLIRDRSVTGAGGTDDRISDVPALITLDVWQQANQLLDNPRQKKATHLLSGIVQCSCGGRMLVPSNNPKYVCRNCRRKVPNEDLETVFLSALGDSELTLLRDLHSSWSALEFQEKRSAIEQICDRIIVGLDTIAVEFSYSLNSPKPVADEQQAESGNTAEVSPNLTSVTAATGPLITEANAAKFLGISKMTLLRKRHAGEIGFYRVGFRILYSMEKHLLPFLQERESRR